MKNSGRPLLRMLCVTLALLAALAAPAGAVGEEKTGESKGILYRVTGTAKCFCWVPFMWEAKKCIL